MEQDEVKAVPFLLTALLFSLLYTAAFQIGMWLYFQPANVSALWPACGVSMVFLLRITVRQRWILLGLLFFLHLANSWNLGSVPYAIGVSVAATVEAVCAVAICQRGNHDVCTTAGLLRLATASAFASLCGGVLGAGSIVLFVPGVELSSFQSILTTWCLADLTGMMLIAPMALAWLSTSLTPGVARYPERILLLLLVGVVSWKLFIEPGQLLLPTHTSPYLIVPFLMWAALRTNPAVVASIATAMSFAIVITTKLGLGPFSGASLDPNTLALSAQIFIATVLLSPLVLATVIADHQAEAQARWQSEEDLRITLDSIADGVVTLDRRGNVTGMNPVAQQLTGWALEEAEGHPGQDVLRFVDPAARKEIPLVSLLEERKRDVEHALLMPREGLERHVGITAAPILTRRQAEKGAVIVLRDVTEEYALQQRLRQSEKMQAIGQLAGGVAHDFNNMLSGILGAAELLGRRRENPEAFEKYLGLITDTSLRAADLTEKLLAFARSQPADSAVLDIHRPLLNALELLRAGLDGRIVIRENLHPDKLPVRGDASQLQNAFLNLLLNASQAMPEGGELTVTSRWIELSPEYCAASPFLLTPGPFAEVAVRDNGCGMPAQLQERIFEPFFTTKGPGKGSGLGLAAVLGTVEQHSGAVSLYSETNVGTSFHILIPASCETPATEAQPTPPPRFRAATARFCWSMTKRSCVRPPPSCWRTRGIVY